ncbi:hypothetical protein FMUND_3378 [Fusarium mundagurra]|uniref:F-box domain-containing protein n=1 Tax=Fusarium mundagurra TaxID=1567541 RepID=A0A8H5Z0X6_9HYPO|nr:hypothetical protein FMUND_3378 [Fusarium mundagurra]
MAGLGTTPALATMPTEIVCMIGDNMSFNEIKDWTLVSKRFREILLPRICKHLKFFGNMEELTNSLNAYFKRKTASFRHLAHHHTRFVTFEVTKFNNIFEMRAWVQRYGVDTIPIGRFLADTPNLQGVVFDFWFPNPKEESRFISFIRRGADWHGPEHLYFKKYPEHYDIGKIVGRFKAGALKGISLPPTSLLDHCGQIARNGANLTSLCLGKYLCLYYRDLGIAVFNNDVANTIGKDFPHLESLEIYDRFSRRDLPLYRGYADSYRWCREIAKAAFILTELRRLRRFAISMCPVESKDISMNSIKRQLLAMTKKTNKGLVPHEVHGPEGVFKLVATYFAAHAKGLEEVCITNGNPVNPVFYRATLTGDVWNISKESFEDPSQKYLFPNVLGN